MDGKDDRHATEACDAERVQSDGYAPVAHVLVLIGQQDHGGQPTELRRRGHLLTGRASGASPHLRRRAEAVLGRDRAPPEHRGQVNLHRQGSVHPRAALELQRCLGEAEAGTATWPIEDKRRD